MSMFRKTAIGRSDLVWMLARAKSEDERKHMAQPLGYAHPSDKPSDKNDKPDDPKVSNPTDDKNQEQPEQSTDETPDEVETEIPHIPLGLWRVIAANIKDKDQPIEAPRWLADATPITGKYLRAAKRIEDSSRPFLYLTPWARLWPFLHQVLSHEVELKKIDVPKLVNKIAQLEPVCTVPKKRGRRWADSIYLLRDKSEATSPFWKDMNFLGKQLSKICGKHRIKTFDFTNGLAGKCSRVAKKDKLKPFKLTHAQSTVLVLSDVERSQRSAPSVDVLTQLGRRLKQTDGTGVVLAPAAPLAAPAALRALWCVVSWDLGIIPGKHPVCDAHQDDIILEPSNYRPNMENSFSRFLALVSPLVRLDTEVVRYVRTLPGVNGTYATWESDVCTGSLESLRREHQKHFKQLPFLLRKQFVYLLYWCHSGFLEIRSEEMAIIKAIDSEMRPIIDDLKDAERELADIVAALRQKVPGGDIPSEIRPYLARREERIPKTAYWDDDRLAATWVLSRVDKSGNFNEADLPSYIPLDKVSWALVLEETQDCRLSQVGQSLVVNASHSVPASPIADIPTALPYLFVQQTNINERNDKQRWMLDSKSPLILSAQNTPSRIRIESSHGHLELEQISKPTWADEIGRDKTGLYVLFGEKRYFWLNPGRYQLTGTAESGWGDEYGGGWSGGVSNTGNVATIGQGHWLEEQIYEWFLRDQTLPGELWEEHILKEDVYGLYEDVNISGIVNRFRWIPPGEFTMGSPEGEPERSSDEKQHEVVLTHGFWLADTACTQELWKAVMGKNPSRFKGKNNPVEKVSWDDCLEFIKKVHTVHLDLNISLPTEAQWEYACRAGTKTPFSFGKNITPAEVNYNGDYPYDDGAKGEVLGETVDVKLLPANPWGLYQMHGNVWEWCSDRYGDYPTGKVVNPKGPKEGDGRVLRGGSWVDDGEYCRSAFRLRSLPDFRYSYTGFRFSLGQVAQAGAAEPRGEEPEVERSETGESTSEKRGIREKLFGSRKNKK